MNTITQHKDIVNQLARRMGAVVASDLKERSYHLFFIGYKIRVATAKVEGDEIWFGINKGGEYDFYFLCPLKEGNLEQIVILPRVVSEKLNKRTRVGLRDGEMTKYENFKWDAEGTPIREGIEYARAVEESCIK